MTISPAQVTSRSDSDLIIIAMIANNTSMSTPARMEAIAARVAEWDRATDGSTGRAMARREYGRRQARPYAD